jgi:hypothetical protein
MRQVYKFLEIDNHQAISDDIYNYLVNHTELLKFQNYCFFNHISPIHIVQHVPSLKQFLDNNCLKPIMAGVILVPPVPPDLEKSNLHVDVVDPYVRILWPIKNCQGSLTKMFNIPRECLKLISKENAVSGAQSNPENAQDRFYQIVGDQNWPLINEFELIQPALIDTSVAHEVQYAPGTTEYRISFTMGFDQDLPISKSIDAWPELNF